MPTMLDVPTKDRGAIRAPAARSGRALLLIACAVHAVAAAASVDDAGQQNPLEEVVAAVHRNALVLDAHVDVLLPGAGDRDQDDESQSSLRKLRQGGIDAVVLALAVGPGPRDVAGVAAARAEVTAKLQELRHFVEHSEGLAAVAGSPGEVEAARHAGRIAIIPGFLNARSIGADLEAIDELHADGVRVFGLVHAGHNDWADSSRPAGGPVQEHGGLSALGRKAIPRLNALGIMIDVSHLSPAGVLQVTELSRAPVIASHSAVRALVDTARNLSDQEILAIARTGGVVHVTAFSPYLRSRVATAEDTLFRASVADFIDHIDYVVALAGLDHVGIGTDFNHGAGIEGFESSADAHVVTRELLRRGYDEAQIAAIWGGNFLRAWREVEAVAAPSEPRGQHQQPLRRKIQQPGFKALVEPQQYQATDQQQAPAHHETTDLADTLQP